MKLAAVGYVLVSQLIASHPLHAVLVQYDREIAALQRTQRVAGLSDPASSAARGAAALQRDAAVAAAAAQRNAQRNARSDLARERTAIDAVTRSQRDDDAMTSTYASQLTAATNANLRAYGGAMAIRTQRAYAAREQQLREKELTLAYDLGRRDAGKRLQLRLKRDDLHLSPAARAVIRGELATLDASELRSIQAMRRTHAAELAVYRARLLREAGASASDMDAQLNTKAKANYAILRRAFNEGASGAGSLPSASQFGVLLGSYAPARSARQISRGMLAASDDLSAHFAQARAADAQSQNEVAAQLRLLRADRAALYRSIVAQIESDADAVARQRGLERVDLASRAARGVDLTPEVRTQLARDW